MERIGFVGLGIMGSRMAANLAPRGLRADRLQPHARARRGVGRRARRDRRRHAGRGRRGERRRHHDGRRRRPGRRRSCSATTASPPARPRARCASTCRRSPRRRRAAIGAALAERGIGFVDAPVTGSSPKAEDGTLTIMAGGTADDFARAQPLLRGHGRARRPRRRARPGRDGEAHQQRRRRGQRRTARRRRSSSARHGRRPRRARAGHGRRERRLARCSA